MISPDPETVVDLPVDQLGLMVLRDFFETEGWNERNYVLEAQQRAGYVGDAAQAITRSVRVAPGARSDRTRPDR
jgi:hypothetical protein